MNAELRDSLIADIGAAAEALAQGLGALPRGERKQARQLVREAWAATQNPQTAVVDLLEVARTLDDALTPPSFALGHRLWHRLHQHWPLRMRCLEPQSIAPAADAAIHFHEVRQARVDWLWNTMRTDDDGTRHPDSHAGVSQLDFSVVEKGGRK